jgi:hypothetical protein
MEKRALNDLERNSLVAVFREHCFRGGYVPNLAHHIFFSPPS